MEKKGWKEENDKEIEEKPDIKNGLVTKNVRDGFKQDRQYMYNVTLRCIHKTTAVVEKKQ